MVQSIIYLTTPGRLQTHQPYFSISVEILLPTYLSFSVRSSNFFKYPCFVCSHWCNFLNLFFTYTFFSPALPGIRFFSPFSTYIYLFLSFYCLPSESTTQLILLSAPVSKRFNLYSIFTIRMYICVYILTISCFFFFNLHFLRRSSLFLYP